MTFMLILFIYEIAQGLVQSESLIVLARNMGCGYTFAS